MHGFRALFSARAAPADRIPAIYSVGAVSRWTPTPFEGNQFPVTCLAPHRRRPAALWGPGFSAGGGDFWLPTWPRSGRTPSALRGPRHGLGGVMVGWEKRPGTVTFLRYWLGWCFLGGVGFQLPLWLFEAIALRKKAACSRLTLFGYGFWGWGWGWVGITTACSRTPQGSLAARGRRRAHARAVPRALSSTIKRARHSRTPPSRPGSAGTGLQDDWFLIGMGEQHTLAARCGTLPNPQCGVARHAVPHRGLRSAWRGSMSGPDVVSCRLCSPRFDP
jgi:hypothetical protein